jgi:hypothetical protein
VLVWLCMVAGALDGLGVGLGRGWEVGESSVSLCASAWGRCRNCHKGSTTRIGHSRQAGSGALTPLSCAVGAGTLCRCSPGRGCLLMAWWRRGAATWMSRC